MAGLSSEHGTYLVALARRAIGEYFANGKRMVPDRKDGALSEKRGVFVTLEEHPSHELRGCIGYPLPVRELALAVVDNALHAAFEDPRFSPLEKDELSKITVEVSVLSVPEVVAVSDPAEYPKKIKVGRDGLMIEYGYSSGLLLPQVPIEWNWNETEFLGHLCEKAGLPRDMWKSPSVKIMRFEASVFCEGAPGGKIVKKRLFK